MGRKVFWLACIVGSIMMINGCSKLSNVILPKDRPLLVCGKQDDNGDGKINIDDGATGLFAVRINSDKVQFDRLTDPDLEYQEVLVSPTGEHIAYRATTRDTNGDGKANVFGDGGYGVYIADVDLDHPKEIIYVGLESDIQWVEWFTWSRDGSQLSISTKLKSGANEVWIVSVDNLEKQQLSFDEYILKVGKDFSWAVSPDGRHQLLPLISEEGWVLADANATISDADQYPLLTDQIPDSWWRPVSWSPDGEHILLQVSEGPLIIESKIDQNQLLTEITVEPNSRYSLYSIDREGSDLIRLGPIGIGTLLNYAWSPDGNQLAFLSEWEDTDGDDLVDSESKHKPLLYLVNLDGSQVRILLRGEESKLWLGSCLSW